MKFNELVDLFRASRDENEGTAEKAENKKRKIFTKKQLEDAGVGVFLKKGGVVVFENGLVAVTEKHVIEDFDEKGNEITVEEEHSTVFEVGSDIQFEFMAGTEEAKEGTQLPGYTCHYYKDNHGCKMVATLEPSFYGDLDWYIALSIIGGERLSHNADSRYGSHIAYHICGEDENTDYEKALREQEEDREKRQKIYEKLDEAMTGLTDRQREIVTLYYYHNLSQKEIAKKLGIGQSTVSDGLRGAVKKLRKMMDK